MVLDAGADKEKANNEGATPLRVGTEQGNQAVVTWLLRHQGRHTVAFCC